MPVSSPGCAGGDRVDISLPATQDRLLRALHATGKPIVLVLTTGSPIAVEWANENVPAILVAWYPGQQGGSAVADVLFGATNPSGRLPITFHKSVDELPPFADYRMKGRTYRYFEGEPQYPFGHGLSYTRFEYSDLRLQPTGVAADQAVEVSLSVANTGRRAGHEVVQLYARALDPKVTMPLKQLSGFERVWLEAGEKRRLLVRLTPADSVSHYDVAAKQFPGGAGDYEVEAGASSRDRAGGPLPRAVKERSHHAAR
jgi:beta-glucosidase